MLTTGHCRGYGRSKLMLFLCPNTHYPPVRSTGSARTSPTGRALLAHPEARALPFVACGNSGTPSTRHPSATHCPSIVAKPATIHPVCAIFRRNSHNFWTGFAENTQNLVASGQVAGEHLLCLRTGLLLAQLSCYLQALFWHSDRPRKTRHVTKNAAQNQLQRALSATADRRPDLSDHPASTGARLSDTIPMQFRYNSDCRKSAAPC